MLAFFCLWHETRLTLALYLLLLDREVSVLVDLDYLGTVSLCLFKWISWLIRETGRPVCQGERASGTPRVLRNEERRVLLSLHWSFKTYNLLKISFWETTTGHTESLVCLFPLLYSFTLPLVGRSHIIGSLSASALSWQCANLGWVCYLKDIRLHSTVLTEDRSWCVHLITHLCCYLTCTAAQCVSL